MTQPGGNASNKRLAEALRPFIHRKTYGCTYFTRPIVPIRKFTHTPVEVEFLNIEKVIYDKILNEGVEAYNCKLQIYESRCRIPC